MGIRFLDEFRPAGRHQVTVILANGPLPQAGLHPLVVLKEGLTTAAQGRPTLEMGWDGIGYMGRDTCNAMPWGAIGWDGMGYIEWDGIGWGGVGWEKADSSRQNNQHAEES